MNNNLSINLLIVSTGLLLGIVIPMLGWQFSIFVPLGCAIILFEVKKIKKKGTFDYLTYINVMYLIVFVLAPINLLINNESVRHYLQSYNLKTVILSVLIIYIAYILIIIGYRIGMKKEESYSAIVVNRNLVNNVLKTFCILFFAIGVTSFLFYSKIYGGILELYKKSDFIRSGYVQNNGFIFLEHLEPYILLSSWILFSFLITKKRKIIIMILSLLSLIISMTVLFSDAGRLELVYSFLPVFLSPYIIKKRLPPISLTTLFSMLAIFWFVNGDKIFSWISYDIHIQILDHKNISFYFYSFLSEFTHPYDSLLIALDKVPSEMDFRFFKDFFYGLMSLVPEKLLGVSIPDTIASYNTYFLLGKFESTVPPGFLALLFYSFSIPGVLFGSIFFGTIIGKTEKFLLKLEFIHPFFGFAKTAVGITFAFFIMSGEPRVYFQTWFWLFSGLFVIYWNIKIFCKSKYVFPKERSLVFPKNIGSNPITNVTHIDIISNVPQSTSSIRRGK